MFTQDSELRDFLFPQRTVRVADQRRTFDWDKRSAGSRVTSGRVDGVRNGLQGRFGPRFSTMYAYLGKGLRLVGSDVLRGKGEDWIGQRFTFGCVKRITGSRVTFGRGDGVRNGRLGRFRPHSKYRRRAEMVY